MKTSCVLLLSASLLGLPSLTALAKEAPAAVPALVPFSAPASIQRLERSRHKVDFFHLANQFESQGNKAFCGPTSAAIVLNALRVDNAALVKPQDDSLVRPEDRALLPAGTDPLFHRYTQNNFFDEASSAVKTRAQVFGQPRTPGEKPSGGLQLRELHGMLAAKGLDVKLRVADATLTDAAVLAELKDNLETAEDYVIINYHRPALGQKGGGHISPLGAYDEASRSFLVMDVNPNGQSWVWVPQDALLRSLRTPDSAENRGYLLVREGRPATAQETK